MNRHSALWILAIGLIGGLVSMGVNETVEGRSISNTVWGVALEAPGYEVWKDHPLRGQPNFVLAGMSSQDGCSLNISVFAILIGPQTTAAQCREGYAGNPEPLREKSDVTLHADAVAPVTYTLFDQSLGSQGTQNQLYGYWTRSGTCFELHVSSVSCATFAEVALPILRSVQVTDDPDVTIETVTMAQLSGKDPHDWEVHLQVASALLHGVDPPISARARHFYESAKRLGQGALNPMEQWTIEEGVGLTWLAQDDGANAIPSLERAVQIAREAPALGEALGESLFNLACAHSLAGDPARACEHLATLLERQDRPARKETLSKIRKDPQLEAVTKDACFDTLKASVKK